MNPTEAPWSGNPSDAEGRKRHNRQEHDPAPTKQPMRIAALTANELHKAENNSSQRRRHMDLHQPRRGQQRRQTHPL
jgi:hypothetical protein